MQIQYFKHISKLIYIIVALVWSGNPAILSGQKVQNDSLTFYPEVQSLSSFSYHSRGHSYGNIPFITEIGKDFNATEFLAHEPQGIIGVSAKISKENPRDNYFTIEIPEDVDLDHYDAVLRYQLFGVDAASQTTKSINHSKVYGGQSITLKEEWQEVTEYMPQQHLKTGWNEVFFNRRSDASYQYQIKELRIELVKKNLQKVYLSDPQVKNRNGKMHLVGFAVEGIDAVSILGRSIPVNQGMFECVLDEVDPQVEHISIIYDMDNETYTSAPYDVEFDPKEFNYAFEGEKEMKADTWTEYISIGSEKQSLSEADNSINVNVEGLGFKELRPLNPDIKNVTGGVFLGYRTSDAVRSDQSHQKLYLSFDTKKIPSGFSAKDIHTFAYDAEKRTWTMLRVDSLDFANQRVISKYQGATDYVNGIIKVPEMAETANYTPTTIKDMKYADPAAGVVSVAPPTISNNGVASTRFPIKLPVGRNGMTPQLSVEYNSENGNGWMGLGWNLQLPAMTLDTRWGAPRFNSEKETELYLLNGQSLVQKINGKYVNPHRTDQELARNTATEGPRYFYLRKEGQYLEIIRYGSTPETYRWRVTDKNGIIHYYGGNPSNVAENAVVRNPGGAITHWALLQSVDPFGNYVHYSYDQANIPVNGLDAHKFYPDWIRYTLKSGEGTSYYEVNFKRNEYTLGSTETIARVDTMLNARSGAMMVSSDLLTEISIAYHDGLINPIRTYRFDYTESAFRKSQLSRISEYDTEGRLFYSNTMDYYDEVGNGNIIDNNEVEWTSNESNVMDSPIFDLVPSAYDNQIPRGTSLGSATSKGFSFGLRLGIGKGKDVQTTKNTLGFAFNYKKEKKKTQIELIDVNGDGRPDKVYKSAGNILYLPNLGLDANGNGVFGSPQQIQGITELDNTLARTNLFGIDLKLKKIGAGVNWSRTRTSKDEYFKDFNGDGLPDFVSNGAIRFNTTQSWTTPAQVTYNNNPLSTQNPIVSGKIDTNLILSLDLQTLDELRAEHSQFDHVKVWQAPYDGVINISGDAWLREKNDCDNPDELNRFRIRVERGIEGQGDFTTTITNSTKYLSVVDIIEPYSLQNVSVSKGEYLFFRIHNEGYGCGGEVEWNPEINYLTTSVNGIPNAMDEHDKNTHVFSSAGDLLLNNSSGWEPGGDDDFISIDLNIDDNAFDLYDFSDTVRFQIERLRYELTGEGEIIDGSLQTQIWTTTYFPEDDNLNIGYIPSGFTNVTNQYQSGGIYAYVYRFYVESETNVQWQEVDWRPSITATAGVFYPAVTYMTYDDNVNQSKYWFEASEFEMPSIDPNDTSDADSPFHVISNSLFDAQSLAFFLPVIESDEFPIEITWSVKQDLLDTTRSLHQETFYLHRLDCFMGLTCQYQITTTLDPNTWDVIYPVNGYDDRKYYQYDLTKGQVRDLKLDNGRIFSALYLKSAAFGRNCPAKVRLTLHPDEMGNYSYTPHELNAPFFARRGNFYGVPYRGWGQFLYNGGARYDLDDEGEIIPNTFQTFDVNIDMTVLDFGITDTDVNLDPNSALDGQNVNDIDIRYALYGLDENLNYYENRSLLYKEEESVFYGRNSSNQLTSKIGRFGEFNLYSLWTNPDDLLNGGVFAALKKRTISRGSGVTADASLFNLWGNLGLSGEVTYSQAKSKVLVEYVDLNGDKYPDLVTRDFVQYTNMLGGLSCDVGDNVGNDFTSGAADEDATAGLSVGGNPPESSSIDLSKTSDVKMKGKINASFGRRFDERKWIDMNGDGLKDRLTLYKTHVTVALNLGYGFSNEIVWGGGYQNNLSGDRNSQSLGATAVGNHSLYVGVSIQQGFGSTPVTVVDVNGDKLPDLVSKIDGSSTFVCYQNNGIGFDSAPSLVFYQGSNIMKDRSVKGKLHGTYTFGFSIPIALINIKIVFTPTADAIAGVSEKRISLKDMDGDGLVDVVFAGDDNGEVIAKLNRVGKTNYLKTVHTPLGGSWTIDYKKEGNTFDLPKKKYVLSKIITHDGFGADGVYGPDQTLTTVSYEKPKFDKRNREFLGFGKVKINQDDPANANTYRYSLTEYHNKNVYLKGLTKKSSTHEATGEKLTETKMVYNIMDPDGPATNLAADVQSDYLQDGLPDEFMDYSRLFVAPVKTISTNYENGESLSLEKQFNEYDAKGNLVVCKNLGDTYTLVPGLDAYRTEIDYYPSVTGVINSGGFAREIKVFAEGDNELLRKREAAYFKNKVSNVKVQLNDSEIQETVIDYDSYGNIQTATLANGFLTNYEYDNEIHTYPVLTSNIHGHTSNMKYDYRFGVPVEQVDVNGHTMRTRYDNRGRIIEVTAPKEIYSTSVDWTLRMQYEGEDSIPATFVNDNYVIPAMGSFVAADPGTSYSYTSKHYAVTRRFTEQAQDNQLVTIRLVDGLGNIIQQKKSHFLNENGTGLMRWMLSGKQRKDAFGRVIESYLPTLQTSYPSNSNSLGFSDFNYVSGHNNIPPLQMTYDTKDRKVSITQSGESTSSIHTFGIEEGMFTTTVTNELSQTFKSFKDVRNRLRKTIQNDELTTRYYYNEIGEQIKTKNHQGYETFYKYDLAGRKLEERHPDRGVNIYNYDLVGNIINKATSNLLTADSPQSIEYVYDFDQLIGVNYPNDPENNVTYIYGEADDSSAATQNAIGRPFMQVDASGVQGFGYDELGNLTNHLKGVSIAGRHTFWFWTLREYDSQNRVKSIVYPDLERVTYEYNPGGNLSKIARTIVDGDPEEDLVSLIRYNALGEKTSVEYGNNTSINYTYDDRRRMKTLGYDFQNFDLTNTYSYNTLSNVEGIISNTGANSIPGIGELGGRIAHTYEYDNYNRLVRAFGRYTGPNDYGSDLLAQEYELDMEYDLAHNIISKTQSHVQGAVSSMGGAISSPEIVANTNYALEYEAYGEGSYIVEGLDTEYGYVQPHAVRNLQESPNIAGVSASDPRNKKKVYTYDANGNQLAAKEVVFDLGEVSANLGVHDPDTITLYQNLWDDEDRLRAVDLNPEESSAHPVAIYTYDAAGQRKVRYIPGRLDAWSNGNNISSNERDEVMMYPSPMLTAKALTKFDHVPTENDTVSSYTKHYYSGSSRIASRLGSMVNLGLFPTKATNIFPGIRDLANQQVIVASNGLRMTYLSLGQEVAVPFPVVEDDLEDFLHPLDDPDSYWFHKDHLGSSSYITNDNGIVTQHMEYLPFGETLVDEHLNSYNTPYKFNGKELDDETGNYYYGARYYNPKVSIWLSVDPLTHQYPSYSSYNYTLQNPVKFVDPDGRYVWKPEINEKGEVSYVAQKGDSAQSLASQYGLSLATAEKLTRTKGDTPIKEGTRISGLRVKNHTNSEVLPLNLTSKEGSQDQTRLDQVLFAMSYAKDKSPGGISWAFRASEFFSNRFDASRSLFTGAGQSIAGMGKIDGLDVYFTFFVHTSIRNSRNPGGDIMIANYYTNNYATYSSLFPKNKDGSRNTFIFEFPSFIENTQTGDIIENGMGSGAISTRRSFMSNLEQALKNL